MIRRRQFISLLGGAAAAWPGVARGQRAIPTIGILSEGGRDTFGRLVEAFKQGLLELGYVEGKNIKIEYRWGDGRQDRLYSLAAELVHLNVDVLIAAGGAQPVLAAKQLGTTLPIVMTNVADPVRFGIVTTLRGPAGI